MFRKIFFALAIFAIFSLGFENIPVEKSIQKPLLQKPLVNTYAPEECTYYAATMRPDLLVIHGHAKDWGVLAERAGYFVDKIPRAGDVIVFGPGVLGADSIYGHIAYSEVVATVAGGYQISLSEGGFGITKEQRQQVHRRTITVTAKMDIWFIHQGPANGNQLVQLPTQTARPQPTATPRRPPTPTSRPQGQMAGRLPDMSDPLSIVRWSIAKMENRQFGDLAAATGDLLGTDYGRALGWSVEFAGFAIDISVDEVTTAKDYASLLETALADAHPVCMGWKYIKYDNLQSYPFLGEKLYVFFSGAPLSKDATNIDPVSDLAVLVFARPNGGPLQAIPVSEVFQLTAIGQFLDGDQNGDPAHLEIPIAPCP